MANRFAFCFMVSGDFNRLMVEVQRQGIELALFRRRLDRVIAAGNSPVSRCRGGGCLHIQPKPDRLYGRDAYNANGGAADNETGREYRGKAGDNADNTKDFGQAKAPVLGCQKTHQRQCGGSNRQRFFLVR